jgi:hypothetical protein
LPEFEGYEQFLQAALTDQAPADCLFDIRMTWMLTLDKAVAVRVSNQ